MIAEYERAQILERSRRGKRHRARSGEVSVLSGAPYGYLYVRKTDESPAAYRVIDAEARVVQRVYEMYTVEGLSIGEITRRLNAEGIPTRKQSSRWERSVVWAMLRNPAYRGVASFGKTRVAGRERVTRALRRRGGIVSSDTIGHQRPHEEWIEIPVPALVSEESFARAQELLQENRVRSRRRTITPSIVQGLVSCQKCGYAFSRTSTQTSARKLHYYKCIGSDSWRKLGGSVCDNGRLVRQDLIDQIVWAEVIRLLEDPTLIQQELERRLAAARASDPTKNREQSLQRELVRVGNSIERILNAYQEQLLSLEQLRERMPPLRQREQTVRTELQAIADQAGDRAMFLRLAETLTAFLSRLRDAADTLDVLERQRIVRLVVKEILIGDDTIVIRHCIPLTAPPPADGTPPTPGRSENIPVPRNYLLRKGSDHAALGRAFVRREKKAFVQHAGPQELSDQPSHLPVSDTRANALHQQVVVDMIEASFDVALNDPLIRSALAQAIAGLCSRTYRHADMLQGGVTAPSGSKPIRDMPKRRLEDRLQQVLDRTLHEAIGDSGNAQRSEFPRLARLWNPLPAARARLKPSGPQVVTKLLQETLASHCRANASHCPPVDPGGSSAFIRGDLPPCASQVA